MATETWQSTVEAGGAEMALASIQMGSGRLTLSGGAEALLDGTFEYSDPGWRPEVDYDIRAGVGHLILRPPRSKPVGLPDPRYGWDLRLGRGIPVGVDVKLGSGQAALQLDGVRVTRLLGEVGSGQVTAELGGEQPDLEEVSLSSGSGRLALLLRGSQPRLRTVTMRNASGLTDLALGGEFAVLERLQLASASGDINIGLSGELTQLGNLDVKVASGTIDLNLSEARWQALDASLDCVSGTATVVYPAEVGVFVRFSSVTGRIDAAQLVKSAGGYATPDFEEASSTLSLSVSTVSGRLVLQPSET